VGYDSPNSYCNDRTKCDCDFVAGGGDGGDCNSKCSIVSSVDDEIQEAGVVITADVDSED
jgi:hypothetical protein